jgi:hypothetical protein
MYVSALCLLNILHTLQVKGNYKLFLLQQNNEVFLDVATWL